MDLISLAVVGTSGTLAYLNQRNKTLVKSSKVDNFTNKKGIDPSIEKSEDFLKVRLSTMLQEGTLDDVKAVLFQIEDVGLQEKIPDYKRAKNIIQSAVNPCGKPQVVNVPTRYQNQSINEFTNNNFVPFFRGRNTQNMIGTDVPSGNWVSDINVSSSVTSMKLHTGNDEFIKPAKSSRDPEARIFSVKELGTDEVWGSSLKRAELDRYVNINNSKPDLRPTEKIQVGTGLNIGVEKNVGNRGFHEFYRPIQDAKATINSVKKESVSAPAPPKGKIVVGGKTSGVIPFSGGLRPALEEGFGQSDFDIMKKYQGNSYVVNKCVNKKGVDWEQLPNSGPGTSRHTGEYYTQQLLRNPNNRETTAVPNAAHFPGNKMSDVKGHMSIEGDLQNTKAFSGNIKNFNTSFNREKTTDIANTVGIVTKIPGQDTGPAQYYVNENYKDMNQSTIRNITGSAGQLGAFKQESTLDDQLRTTNRQLYTEDKLNKGLYGAVGNRGHQPAFQDEQKHTHRETTSSNSVNHSKLAVPRIQVYDQEESQRNNLRASTIAQHRPSKQPANIMAPVKVRIGSFTLNDLRSDVEVADRPHANTANTQNTWKFGKSTVSDKKIVDTYSDPRIGLNLNMGYGTRAQDSKIDCRTDVIIKNQV